MKIPVTTRLLIILSLTVSILIGRLLWIKKFDVPSFLLNLVTEIIGIIITVFYVQKILSQYEQERWEDVIHELRIKLNEIFISSYKRIFTILGAEEDIQKELLLEIENQLNDEIQDKRVGLKPIYQAIKGKQIVYKIINKKTFNEDQFEILEQSFKEYQQVLAMYSIHMGPGIFTSISKTMNELDYLKDKILSFNQTIPPQSDLRIETNSLYKILASDIYKSLCDFYKIRNSLLKSLPNKMIMK